MCILSWMVVENVIGIIVAITLAQKEDNGKWKLVRDRESLAFSGRGKGEKVFQAASLIDDFLPKRYCVVWCPQAELSFEDYSVVSPWERFLSEIETVVSKWLSSEEDLVWGNEKYIRIYARLPF